MARALKQKLERRPPIVALGVLVVIALFGLTVLFFNESTTVGAVIYDKEKADSYRAYCFNTDPELKFEVKGSVHYQNFVYHDRCSRNGKYLYQVYCASSQRVGTTFKYHCPNGCREGVCV